MEQSPKRLQGSLWIFRKSLNDINGSLLSAVDATNHQRRIIIEIFNNLDFAGTLSKKKFEALLTELQNRNIHLRIDKYPKNRTELDGLRDKLARKYQHRAQFLIDQAILSLAITYEEFVRRLFVKYYTDDPRRINKDKELDIETNAVIGDIADRIDLNTLYKDVAETIVTKLQRDSASRWFDYFEKILKFSLSDDVYLVKKNQVIELFLVRNSIVHNAKFITKDLINHKEKFIGLQKVNPSLNDYKRYRNSCNHIVSSLVRQYNDKYSDKITSVDVITNDLIDLHQQNKSEYLRGVKLDISRIILNQLVAKYKNADLVQIRTLLMSNFYDSKLLALKILIYQYKHIDERGLRKKIFIFCLLNIKLFDSWEMINLLTRNILTGARLVGHNIQLLQAMSSYNSPKMAYLLLRVISANPTIATRRHLVWIVNNTERNTIHQMRGGDRARLVRLRNKTLDILGSVEPDDTM